MMKNKGNNIIADLQSQTSSNLKPCKKYLKQNSISFYITNHETENHLEHRPNVLYILPCKLSKPVIFLCNLRHTVLRVRQSPTALGFRVIKLQSIMFISVYTPSLRNNMILETSSLFTSKLVHKEKNKVFQIWLKSPLINISNFLIVTKCSVWKLSDKNYIDFRCESPPTFRSRILYGEMRLTWHI